MPAEQRTRSPLTSDPDRLRRIRERLISGFYLRPEILRKTAEILIESGDLSDQD